MNKYALVSSKNGFVVMLYSNWIEFQNGCVMQTSNDIEQLEREAEWRNSDLEFMLEYEQYSEFDGSYNGL